MQPELVAILPDPAAARLFKNAESDDAKRPERRTGSLNGYWLEAILEPDPGVAAV